MKNKIKKKQKKNNSAFHCGLHNAIHSETLSSFNLLDNNVNIISLWMGIFFELCWDLCFNGICMGFIWSL